MKLVAVGACVFPWTTFHLRFFFVANAACWVVVLPVKNENGGRVLAFQVLDMDCKVWLFAFASFTAAAGVAFC